MRYRRKVASVHKKVADLARLMENDNCDYQPRWGK